MSNVPSYNSHECKPDSFAPVVINRRSAHFPVDQPDRGAIDVFVATPSGTTLQLAVAPHGTVALLKQMIAQRTGLPEAKQTLSYCGKPLENGNQLSHYHIRRGSTVLMVVPINGGSKCVKGLVPYFAL
jgi:hypothetical protein